MGGLWITWFVNIEPDQTSSSTASSDEIAGRKHLEYDHHADLASLDSPLFDNLIGIGVNSTSGPQ
jgi:hypothetical protein